MRALPAALLATAMSALPCHAAGPVHWNPWADDLFARAKAENRFVILDLEATWCHWCHVMDEKTYSDPKVQSLLAAKYIAVRVDQDASPALSTRYGDWGWPATIVFGPNGNEIAKLRGYIEPERMEALLKAIIDDPTPGPSVDEESVVQPAPSPYLGAALRQALTETFDESYDTALGAWGTFAKYIDADSMDDTLALAEAGDKQATARARQTLDAARALVDPVWGGVDQYSVDGDWKEPHFEKIISFQAQYIRQYAQAYALWHDGRDLETARKVKSYLETFLMSPDGAFYVSQDADLSQQIDGQIYYALDDAGRRKLGLPHIDTHLYARENGWAIDALVAFSNATGDAKVLAEAERAANWVKADRALPGGGFRHSESDAGGPFLGDTLAMGQGFVALYAATGDRHWLQDAEKAADFIGAHFKDESGGFINAKGEAKEGVFTKPDKQIDDQVQVARFMNILFRYDGKTAHDELAKHAMRYIAGAAPNMERPLPGVLLADLEIASEPTHITIVGRKDDPQAINLFAAARAFPAMYERLEWWDTREGPLPNPDVDYPVLDRAAAFACANHICSLPIFTPADFATTVAGMAHLKTQETAR